ncbi:unnamed protein product [Rotaria sp. Silwood1]|nr:unnamed protein product [Rotaria sp. Silwood1]CAF5002780.1 unnamed protein product [Rotaria sp. Silwood1]
MGNTFAKADEVQLRETLDDVSCSSPSTLSELHRNLDASEAILPFCQDKFNDLLNDSDELKEKNPSEYQNLLTPEQNTTETSIELRLAEVDSDDGLSFFLSLLCGFDREDVVPARTLRNNVANHILESRYIKIDNILCEINRETLETYSDKVKQGTILGVPTVLHALASLYPKYLFCTISKTSRTDGRISINVATYVKDISSYKKCVFIFYDGMIDHYNAVFLYNKTNEEEEKSNFKYDNNTMKILLTKFIKEKLKYDNYVNSEDTQVNVEADITVNGFMEHDYIYDSIAHRDVADTEKSLGKYANSWMSNATRTLPSSISNINPAKSNSS